MRALLCLVVLTIATGGARAADSVRTSLIRDISSIEGVRENPHSAMASSWG